MSGNVWEWCQTKYVDELPYRGDDGREDLNGTDYRCLRGGAFDYVNRYMHAAFRLNGSPDGRSNFMGFRVAELLSLYDS